ncbi:MAG: CynX/NimT family MFS transporter [Dermatophilaceae bacterium]
MRWLTRMPPSWIVLVAGVSAALHVGKLPPTLPVLQSELGISLVQAGFLVSLVQLAGMLLGVVIGLVADGFGLRRSMATGLGVLFVAGLAGGWAHDPTSLLLLRAVEGMGFLLATVPGPGLMRRLVAPAGLTRMLGFWAAYMPIGTALALLVGPVVITWVGWPWWWWVTAALSGLVAMWVLAQVPPDPQPQHGSRPDDPWRRRLAQTLGSGGPWLGALTFAVYAAQWLAVIGFLPSLYAESGWGGVRGGLLTAVVAAVNICGNVGAGWLLSRGWAPRSLLWGGFCAMAVGTVAAFSVVTAASPAVRYAGALVFSTFGGLVPGTLFSLAPRLAPTERTISTTVGLLQQWSAIGQVGGPPLVAWVASRVGGWQLTWVVTAACSLVGAALAQRIAAYLARRQDVHNA